MGTDEPNHLEFVVLARPRVGSAADRAPRLLVHDGATVPSRRRRGIVTVAEHVPYLVVDQVLAVDVPRGREALRRPDPVVCVDVHLHGACSRIRDT